MNKPEPEKMNHIVVVLVIRNYLIDRIPDLVRQRIFIAVNCDANLSQPSRIGNFSGKGKRKKVLCGITFEKSKYYTSALKVSNFELNYVIQIRVV